MSERAIIVLDCGKTLAKLSLWRHDGTLIVRETRLNERVATGRYVALDAAGIEEWLAATLRKFSGLADIGSIIPVGHGAAAVIVRGGGLACPPLDYEEPMPLELRKAYDAQRDPFSETGSPALPNGLNLGAQLFWLQSLYPDLLSGDATIMPWAQYWSWLLCGVPAAEITSLGCHTDLWRPLANESSHLARSLGWADRLAPLAQAGDVLGSLDPKWAERTGLAAEVEVHCGLHDSNAALLAARAFPEIADRESTVLSTGTWFVAMRSPASLAEVDIALLPEDRDCLVNVDAFGKPIPSARFMGGREIETLTGLDAAVDGDEAALLAAVPEVLGAGTLLLPTFAPGFGPFPFSRGQWIKRPEDAAGRRAAVSLYAALVADVSLDLIGSRERLLVEGRFAKDRLFVRALAALRPATKVYAADAQNDASFGALRLLIPDLEPQSALSEVMPLEGDIGAHRERWRSAIAQLEQAA